MSGYEPMLSDEVEVVVRGRVTARYSSTGRFDVDDLHSIHPDHVVSVEKVEPPKPPLPTTPGSVIRGRISGWVWLLRDNDKWVSQRKPSRRFDGLPPGPTNYEVIFDAGAES